VDAPSAQHISGIQRVSHGAVNSLNWSGYAVHQDSTTTSWANDSITTVDRAHGPNGMPTAQPGSLNGSGDGFTIRWDHS
jgi:hypothetical protein